VKPLTLRATLRWLAIGAALYVVVIAAIIAVRITPTARALSAHSEQVRGEYQAIDTRAAALRSTIDEIQMWLYTEARPTHLQPALTLLRRRIDSLNASAASTPRLSGIPAAMRVEFSQANVEQSRAATALLEAIANIELGRPREAAQLLARADSLANLNDRHQAAAQRLGLEDLIVREQSLASAAAASMRAVGWWLVLGSILAPFLVVFVRRRFYDPLADLEEGIAQVAEGDLGWTIPVRRADELGRLSEHFNEATAILCQRAEETRQRATTALRESEERYTAMFGAAPIGIAIVDSAGRYAHTNPALQRFLGYSETELRGASYRDVTLPDDLGDSDRRFAALIAGTYDRYSVEKRYVRKDGAQVWGRVSVAGVRDAAGTLTHTISMIEDVTDEKRLQEAQLRAEEARHKSEEKFSTAFRMNPNPSVIARLDDGLLVEVNDAYCAVSGYTRDEVIGKSAREVLWAEPERRDDFVRQLREHGRIRDLEQKMKSKSGPQLDVLLSVERIDLDGVAHVLASAVDITSRKQAAEALRQSEEKFAKAFRVSPNALAITELESGILVDANDAFFATFGYTREEALGRTGAELIWQDPGQQDVYAAKLQSSGQLQSEEVSLRTKAGVPVLALISAELIELGGRTYVLTNVLDITERKRALEALRASEERFRRLVQDMGIGVALLDPEGRILHANPAAREILAMTDAEVDDPLFWQRGLFGLREDGTPYSNEERPILKAVRTGTALRNFLVGVPARGRPAPRWALANVDPQRDPDGTIRNFIVWFSDVTEQRKADQQLRLLAQAVKSTSEMIGITDLHGRFTFVNRAFLEQTGYAEPEVLGHRITVVSSPRNAKRLLDSIRVGTERGGWSGELYMRRNDGTELMTALTTAPVKNSDGKVIALMGVASDITERKRAAQALRESEERYRSLVEASPDAITVVQDGRLRYANPAAFELMGVRNAEDLVGRLALDFTAEESRERAAYRLDAILAGMRDTVEEGRLRRADGSVIDVEATGMLIQYEGRPAVLVIHRDVTARKQAEHQLRLLAQAVKSTTESISITDVDGHITFVNRGFAETCGYTEAELIGQHVSLIDSSRNPSGLQDEVRNVTMTRGTWTGELYNRRKNGTDFLITLTTAQVKDEQGRVIALMGVSSDITERKQLQASLRRSETMSALGSVVAGVAHEVRNPLFGISATVDAFYARFGEQPGYERYAQTLRQEVSRLTKLMQDLLEYGKPQRLDVSRGAIAPVVRRAVAACTALAESSGVWIRDELADNLPPIPMDQSRIQQVFQNLLDNAIQHSARGKGVTITASRTGTGANAMVEITFTDEGTGFRTEDLPRLFEPFFTRRRGGTGLGLSIVHRILEQHGGDVVARNGAAGGAVMTVRLPLVRDTAREPARV
jgi:PAS domain S-box-containing protein